MYTVSLLTFLRNGNFGPIVLGLKREHLDALFGPPDGWSIRRKKDNKDNAAIWLYGSIEFYFSQVDELHMIFSDNLNSIKAGTTFVIDPWVISPSLTLSEAEQALNRERIIYERKDQIQYETSILTLQSGVHLSFHLPENNPEWHLTSFSLGSKLFDPISIR